jgi:hypothetical protein
MAIRRWTAVAIKYHRNVEVKRLGDVTITAEYVPQAPATGSSRNGTSLRSEVVEART